MAGSLSTHKLIYYFIGRISEDLVISLFDLFFSTKTPTFVLIYVSR
jgi:hypothetical protein